MSEVDSETLIAASEDAAEHERWHAEQSERDSRRKAVASELAAILVPLLDDGAYSRVYELIYQVSPIDMRGALIGTRGPVAAVEARSEDV